MKTKKLCLASYVLVFASVGLALLAVLGTVLFGFICGAVMVGTAALLFLIAMLLPEQKTAETGKEA